MLLAFKFNKKELTLDLASNKISYSYLFILPLFTNVFLNQHHLLMLEVHLLGKNLHFLINVLKYLTSIKNTI